MTALHSRLDLLIPGCVKKALSLQADDQTPKQKAPYTLFSIGPLLPEVPASLYPRSLAASGFGVVNQFAGMAGANPVNQTDLSKSAVMMDHKRFRVNSHGYEMALKTGHSRLAGGRAEVAWGARRIGRPSLDTVAEYPQMGCLGPSLDTGTEYSAIGAPT
jgi:hypothetical protein